MSRGAKPGHRRVRLLHALAAADALTLCECVAALGEEGRHASKRTIVMLRTMRLDGQVDYEPPPAHGRPSGDPGRAGGRYSITAEGAAWLAGLKLDEPEESFLPDVVLPTGAMRGESAQVLRTPAHAVQIPPDALVELVFVFSLGQRPAHQRP